MKNYISLLFSFIILVSLSSCEEKYNNDLSYDNFKNFVSHRTSIAYKYNKLEWDELELKYHNLQMIAEIGVRNNQCGNIIEFAKLQKDWDNFKVSYSSERDRLEKGRELEALCNELLPPGVTPDLANVETSNLKDVQIHFLKVVDAHKDELTAEQWDYVNSLWVVIDAKKTALFKKYDNREKSEFKSQMAKFNVLKEHVQPPSNLLAKYN